MTRALSVMVCGFALSTCMPSAFDNLEDRKHDAAVMTPSPAITPSPDSAARTVDADSGSASVAFDASVDASSTAPDASAHPDAAAHAGDAGSIRSLAGDAGMPIDASASTRVHLHAEGGVLTAQSADDRDASAR